MQKSDGDDEAGGNAAARPPHRSLKFGLVLGVTFLFKKEDEVAVKELLGAQGPLYTVMDFARSTIWLSTVIEESTTDAQIAERQLAVKEHLKATDIVGEELRKPRPTSSSEEEGADYSDGETSGQPHRGLWELGLPVARLER